MKKLVFTAAFSMIGMISVSAQTQTPQNVTRDSNNQNQTITQAPQNAQTNSNLGASSEVKTQNQNATATLEATTPASDTTEGLRADVNGESTKPTDAIKEDKRSKKKKSK